MAKANEESAIEAARRLQVEADAEQAETWKLAVEATEKEAGLGADVKAGVFGDHVSLLDFNPDDLARFRALVPFVRLEPSPEFESAIAIAGSAAQGRVQTFPGDADFAERVHIHAPTLEEAHAILREQMRKTALRAMAEPDIVLAEANIGTFPEDGVFHGRQVKKGASIEWTPQDVIAGEITIETEGGERTVAWDEAPVGNGWLNFDWFVAERDQGRITHAGNVMDVTWEDADGNIVPLDGTVNPLMQDIFLEPMALPLVQKLAKHVPASAREDYQAAMQDQVYTYTKVTPSFGKAAKRLYNLFRVSDQLEAAAYVRELFDEPAARLYQVSSLLEAADIALDPDSGIDRETVMQQLDLVAESIAEATEGKEEKALIAAVERLRAAALEEGREGKSWAEVLAEVQTECAELVNEFFRSRLMGFDPVREAVERIGASAPTAAGEH